jgi:nanoRNase/pAp phosphatase (c-di-AMP/oligoRNAs hydrolase)
MVFLVGVHDLETLNQLYIGYESLYQNAFVVTLHTFRPELGNIQLDLSGMSSMSEAMTDILEGMEVPLNTEIATDLLHGIESMTNNLLSLTASAETFETVAKLLRAGARRKTHSTPQVRPEPEKKPVPQQKPQPRPKNHKKSPQKKKSR